MNNRKQIVNCFKDKIKFDTIMADLARILYREMRNKENRGK